MDEVFNIFKKIQKPITIEDLKEEIQEIKKPNRSIKTRKWTNKKYNTI